MYNKGKKIRRKIGGGREWEGGWRREGGEEKKEEGMRRNNDAVADVRPKFLPD